MFNRAISIGGSHPPGAQQQPTTTKLSINLAILHNVPSYPSIISNELNPQDIPCIHRIGVMGKSCVSRSRAKSSLHRRLAGRKSFDPGFPFCRVVTRQRFGVACSVPPRCAILSSGATSKLLRAVSFRDPHPTPGFCDSASAGVARGVK